MTFIAPIFLQPTIRHSWTALPIHKESASPHAPWHTHESARKASRTTPAARLLPFTVPRRLTSRTHLFHDARGHEWEFVSDVLEAEPPTASQPTQTPIILLHPPGAIGFTSAYWDAVFLMLCTHPTLLARHAVARFDWVGTAATQPKPAVVRRPYTPRFYAEQVAHISRMFGQRVVVVAAGEAEGIAMRFALQYPQLVRGVLVATGVATNRLQMDGASVTMYNTLQGAVGSALWNAATTGGSIERGARSRLRDERLVKAWKIRIEEGCEDHAVRHAAFSRWAGFDTEDLRYELGHLDVPMRFLAARPFSKGSAKRDGDVPAVPGRVDGSAMRRMKHRCDALPDCSGVVVDGATTEMFFETPELALREVEDFMQSFS